MRLLHVKTYKLEDFTDQDIPGYAILSHCWIYKLNEILYEDVEYSEPEVWQNKKQGAAEKVVKACAEADRLGFKYIWIDTCCIDKRSSSELSEAINSMFSWYRKSKKCIAFLHDINGLDDLHKSSWFTRGWTLQELIAPDNVQFYNKEWSFISDRFSMARELSLITRIDEVVLRHGHDPDLVNWDDHHYHESRIDYRCNCGINGFDGDRLRGVLNTFSVATIMSWAAGRRTTREEDIAYCLMGLFDVNMPLLYGEKGKAFIRLQEEIIRRTDDQSILAWAMPSAKGKSIAWLVSLARDLASSPDDFSHINIKKRWSLEDHTYDDTSRRHMSVTKEGLEVELLLLPTTDPGLLKMEKEAYFAVLDCAIGDNPLARPALIINKPPWSTNVFDRTFAYIIARITPCVSHSSDGTVSKGIGEMVVDTSVDTDSQSHFEWQEEFNLKQGRVTKITLARTWQRRGAQSRNRFWLPPLRIGKIEDCDSGEYDVDYALPEFDKGANVASPCNERYGLALLKKQGDPRFFVVWGLDIKVSKPYKIPYERNDIWCKALPADDEYAMKTFASAKEWGRHQRVESTSIRKEVLDIYMTKREEFIGASEVDRAVLGYGELRREVLLELKRSRFLGAAFLDLKIQVKLPPQANRIIRGQSDRYPRYLPSR